MTLAYSKPVEARDSQNDGAIVSGLTPTFRYCALDSDGSDVSAFASVAEIGSSGDYQVTYDLSHGDMSFGLDFGSPLIARDRYKSGQVGLVHSSVNAVNGNAIPISGGLANLVPSLAYTPLTPVKANLTQVNGQAFSGYAAPACEYHTGGFTIQQPGTDSLAAYDSGNGVAKQSTLLNVPAGVAAMLLSVQLAEYVSGSSGPLRWTAAALALGSGLTTNQAAELAAIAARFCGTQGKVVLDWNANTLTVYKANNSTPLFSLPMTVAPSVQTFGASTV